MSAMIVSLMSLVFGTILGALGFWVQRRVTADRNRQNAMSEADRILSRARNEASKLERDAKQKAKDLENRIRKNTENDIQKQKQNLKRLEDDIKNREAQLENDFKRKQLQLEKRGQEAESQAEKVKIAEQRLKTLEEQAEKELADYRNRVAQVSQMSSEEAKRELVRALEDEAKIEASKRLAQIEEDLEKESAARARRVISVALSRYAAEYTSERTVSIVALPSDEMKGKIIGREGRNIRALEAACGVDLIVDETPESVVISGFDPVRREIAKRALEKLMEDGRVHPGRIEEVIDKVKKDLLKSIREDGEKACFELGLHGVHPEIMKLVGSLKYRSTSLLNNYVHSMEVAWLAGMMAEEVGADVKLARRAGLLHDIGKAVEHSVDGSHPNVGAEMAKRYGESDVVVQAIRSHEGDIASNDVISFIVQTANLMSNSRTGAKRPGLDSFVRRLEDIESIGNSFDGVSRTFAVQSGREVKVLVESAKVTDEQAQMLSRDIARKIERELNYPGQIKVSVVRETRIVEMAR